MPVTVIVGGQFGSEGKGKVAHYLAREKRASVAIRVGGSNSGHTVIDETGAALVFRMLPTAAILPETICVLGAGSYIDVGVLFHEIEVARLASDRLVIDPNAYIVTDEHKRTEAEWGIGKSIGSTQSGTGAAVVERARRISATHLAQNDDRLARFICPTHSLLRARLQHGENVIVEGTQGYGLSVLHSPYYPKATSRDTTAASFVAEAGLSPLDVEDVVLVIRAFPIRVAGDSGTLPDEIDWETVTREGGWKKDIIEHTSVTKNVRRVGRFNAAIVREAIDVNRPTLLVLNHIDYLDSNCSSRHGVTRRMEAFVNVVENDVQWSINYLGISPTLLVAREQWKKVVGVSC